MPAITIITCTRNPDPDALRRVLVGIEALRVPDGWTREFILVDSASTHPLAERAEEKLYTSREPWARIVRCDEPGLSLARRAGIAAAAGDLLVWFDDDNVPEPDYLLHVARVAAAHPEVTVWGAGTIVVEYTGRVPHWIERDMRPFFQERAHGRDEFGRATTWMPYFPVGSGLVTRRGAAERWAEGAASGRYSLTGRRGDALAAGDDAQIIFGAVAAGEQVGVVARQALLHLIPPERCTGEYLARMEFGISASLRIARAECFPEEAARERAEGHADLSLIAAARAALKALPAHGVVDGPRHARLEVARRLGALAGACASEGRPEPEWLRAAVAMLGLR
jgi:glycosyltransferase involved in cell wall biosynthesis